MTRIWKSRCFVHSPVKTSKGARSYASRTTAKRGRVILHKGISRGKRQLCVEGVFVAQRTARGTCSDTPTWKMTRRISKRRLKMRAMRWTFNYCCTCYYFLLSEFYHLQISWFLEYLVSLLSMAELRGCAIAKRRSRGPTNSAKRTLLWPLTSSASPPCAT